MAGFPGRFADGSSGAIRNVTVIIGDGSIEVCDEAGFRHAIWRGEDVRLLEGGGRDDWVAFCLADGSLARLRLPRQAFDSMRQACPSLTRTTPAERRAWRHVAGWTVAAVIGIFVTFRFLLPWAADAIAEVLPPETEMAMGRQVYAGLQQWQGDRGKTCSGAAGQEALDILVRRLSVIPPRLPVQLRVIDHPMINAIALPGGYIVLTSGLLEFVGSAAELGGIIAHEMGHIDARHNVAGAIRVGAGGIVVGLLFGDVIGGIGTVAVAQHVMSAAYTREFETEADLRAMQRLQQAGIDPAGLADFFRRLMGREGSLPAILNTHPASEARAEMFAAARKPAASPLTTVQWAALKALCRS